MNRFSIDRFVELWAKESNLRENEEKTLIYQNKNEFLELELYFLAAKEKYFWESRFKYFDLVKEFLFIDDSDLTREKITMKLNKLGNGFIAQCDEDSTKASNIIRLPIAFDESSINNKYQIFYTLIQKILRSLDELQEKVNERDVTGEDVLNFSREVARMYGNMQILFKKQ